MTMIESEPNERNIFDLEPNCTAQFWAIGTRSKTGMMLECSIADELPDGVDVWTLVLPGNKRLTGDFKQLWKLHERIIPSKPVTAFIRSGDMLYVMAACNVVGCDEGNREVTVNVKLTNTQVRLFYCTGIVDGAGKPRSRPACLASYSKAQGIVAFPDLRVPRVEPPPGVPGKKTNTSGEVVLPPWAEQAGKARTQDADPTGDDIYLRIFKTITVNPNGDFSATLSQGDREASGIQGDLTIRGNASRDGVLLEVVYPQESRPNESLIPGGRAVMRFDSQTPPAPPEVPTSKALVPGVNILYPDP